MFELHRACDVFSTCSRLEFHWGSDVFYEHVCMTEVSQNQWYLLHVNGLMQERHQSSALALVLCLFCINSSMCKTCCTEQVTYSLCDQEFLRTSDAFSTCTRLEFNRTSDIFSMWTSWEFRRSCDVFFMCTSLEYKRTRDALPTSTSLVLDRTSDILVLSVCTSWEFGRSCILHV